MVCFCRRGLGFWRLGVIIVNDRDSCWVFYGSTVKSSLVRFSKTAAKIKYQEGKLY
ncbi:hypothetical protein MC7420_2103 [Coleofasciculus chthonoplastes PCC 7420]|uniref:Uncharacterized protein n=1 Tax=Coleofasciculus chthonoplastes PCC 7420 TaxID=118168 RepID=B4VSI9_9CYAN|nr:hypothetical protein MC7420_2103 [Coleofasciculus chthonoplastes PCC 7420]